MTAPVHAVGINHIALEVHDLDAALEWYGRWFDLTLRGRRPKMAWIDLGDQFLALSEGGPELPDRDRHIGLVVSDKEALRAALLEGGEPVDPEGPQEEPLRPGRAAGQGHRLNRLAGPGPGDRQVQHAVC